MNIEGAWKRGYTGKNIVVTILDDGIERTHPDLMQNYVSVCCGHKSSLFGSRALLWGWARSGRAAGKCGGRYCGPCALFLPYKMWALIAQGSQDNMSLSDSYAFDGVAFKRRAVRHHKPCYQHHLLPVTPTLFNNSARQHIVFYGKEQTEDFSPVTLPSFSSLCLQLFFFFFSSKNPTFF